jgi:hypothetical protein
MFHWYDYDVSGLCAAQEEGRSQGIWIPLGLIFFHTPVVQMCMRGLVRVDNDEDVLLYLRDFMEDREWVSNRFLFR